MATIHKATEIPCIVAFDSGNLKPVTKTIKEKYPDKKIIIIADNDIKTQKKTAKNTGIEAGTDAAKAINAKICISPVDSDFNDLFIEQGLESVKKALEKTVNVNIDDWENPVYLEKNYAPEFNQYILPGIIGDMARAVSEATETPIELSVGLTLSVIATACQGKFVVKVKQGYQESLSLWVVTALESGNRKSSVLMKVTAPLNQWESSKKEALKPVITEGEIKLKNKEAILKSLRNKLGKAKPEDRKGIETEINDIENNIINLAKYPKIWTQDVTPEHLGTLLNENNEVMAILSAEGGIFDIIGGRYSNGVPNLDLFLQAHSGDPVRVDRGSRDPVFLNSPSLTLGLSPQPEVLRGLVNKPGFRGRGLLARFLYLFPKSKLGYRTLESNPVPENIKNDYKDLIYKLLDIPHTVEDNEGKQQYKIIKLSKEAYQKWAEFYNEVEVDLREGEQFEHINDWACKFPGLTARIAALLHCAENPDEPEIKNISFEIMNTAIELAKIFVNHAFIAFDMMGADKSVEQARKIWNWIEKKQYKTFSARDCFNALKGNFHRMVNMEEPFKVLVERHYIKKDNIKTGGRPTTTLTVNPKLTIGW